MRSQQVGGNSLRTLFIEAIVIQASLGALLISWEDTFPHAWPSSRTARDTCRCWDH